MTAADRALWRNRRDFAGQFLSRTLPYLYAFTLGVLLCAILVSRHL